MEMNVPFHNNTEVVTFVNYRSGAFVETGSHFWYPDDVTLGYIIGERIEITLLSVIGSICKSLFDLATKLCVNKAVL